MRISSNIEDSAVIRAILDHLDIWLVRYRLTSKFMTLEFENVLNIQ